MKRAWARLQPLLHPVFAVALGLCLGLVVTTLMGENPLTILRILVRGAFGSPYDLGMTLFYTTPLILTGLAVALPFRAGLFNIGAEGQLTLGALAAASVGALAPGVPWPLAPMLATAAAFVAGALWGAIPGWLRARRGSHEVINTIMLNFVAAGLASYVTLYVLPNPESQSPETLSVSAVYFISQWPVFEGAPVSSALVLAVCVALGVAIFLNRSVPGFELQAVGESETAARMSGIDPGRQRLLAMVLAGGIAGLVGVGEVLGYAHRFKLGFSAEYGFVGIAVALLGRGNPLGVLAAAFLFGALHKGTADLDLETEHVTRDISLILQALVILSVSADGLWTWLRKRQER